MPALKIDYTGYFDEMVIMMKESDDVLARRLVEKLILSTSATHEAAHGSTDISTLSTTNREGIECKFVPLIQNKSPLAYMFYYEPRVWRQAGIWVACGSSQALE